MAWLVEHRFLVAFFVTVIVALCGWRVARAELRRLGVFVRSFWPH